MTKQEISKEAKQEVLRLLEERITEYEGLDINKAVLAVNLSIFQEENEELKSKIYQRHIKLYLKYGFDGTNLLWEIEKLKNQNKSLNYYKNSIDYKLGSTLLAIPRKIKSLLK